MARISRHGEPRAAGRRGGGGGSGEVGGFGGGGGGWRRRRGAGLEAARVWGAAAGPLGWLPRLIKPQRAGVLVGHGP